MIPPIEPSEVRYPGERLVYKWLRDGLPKAYVVFHSVQLLQPLRGRPWHLEREADFVILHPELGLLILEVKGGHGIELANGQWSRRGVPMTPQPTDQAREAMHLIEEWLRERACPLPYSYGLVFPEVVWQGSLPPGLSSDQVLDSRMSRDAVGAIELAYGVLAMRRNPPLRPDEVQRCEVALTGLVQTFVPVGVHVDEAMYRFWLLDDLQLQLHREFYGRRPRLMIEGGAGTGKTELALAAAVDRARSGEQVLLTCFNVALAEWLAERAAAAKELRDAPGTLVVRHIHGVASDLAGMLKRPYGHDTRTVTGLLVEGSFHGSRAQRYDAIIVDEGQDFDAEWLMALLEYLNVPTGGFAVLLDPRQRLFDVGGLADSLDLGEPMVLRWNYRNTRRIAEACQFVEPTAPPAWSGTADGVQPDIRVVRAQKNQRDTVRDLVQDLLERQSVGPEQIACLTPYSEMGSLNGLGRIAGRELTSSATRWRKGGSILVTTARSFKGLEAPVVILFDVDVLEGVAFSRTDLYVACSRGRAHLYVVAHGTAVVDAIRPMST